MRTDLIRRKKVLRNVPLYLKIQHERFMFVSLDFVCNCSVFVTEAAALGSPLRSAKFSWECISFQSNVYKICRLYAV